MIPVENSSNVSHIGFDPATNSLKVLFKNGGTYHYKEVEPAHWDQLQIIMTEGGSVGKYLTTQIKPNYAVEKIQVDAEK